MMSQTVPSRHLAEPRCIPRLTPVQGGYAGVDLFVPPSSPVRLWITIKKLKKNKKNEGLGFLSGSTQSTEVTTSPKKVLSPKEVVSNPTSGECGGVGSSSQHTEAMEGEQTSLTKTQKRNRRRQLKKRVEQKEKSTELALKEKEGGTKRPRSEVSTPSPNLATMQKKQRTKDHQVSFAHAVKAFKMAIVKETFPSDRLSNEDFDRVQMEILRKTDVTPLEGHMPKILRSTLQAGAAIILCNDEETANWLNENFHGNKEVVGTALKVLSASSLPKPVKVAFKTKDTYTKEPALLLKRLNRLNPELKSEEWRFIHKLVEPHSIRWIFEVDQVAAEAIRRADFGAYTGLDRGIFKILSDPNKPKGSVDDIQPTSSQVSDSDLSDKNTELLNIKNLQIETSSDDTLQASPMSVSEIEKELQALDDDLKLKSPFSEVGEEQFSS